ncbi:hypothetical protein EMCRGX_G004244 [Ephydatia muelleri]
MSTEKPTSPVIVTRTQPSVFLTPHLTHIQTVLNGHFGGQDQKTEGRGCQGLVTMTVHSYLLYWLWTMRYRN